MAQGKRNLEQCIVIGQGLLSEHRGLTVEELYSLGDTAKRVGIFDGIMDAYYIGIALGYKQAKEDLKRKARA